MSALVAEGLGKRYGRRWALQNCSLSIQAGAVVGLVGANGAGKSTLLHLAVGLLQPNTGRIDVLGRRPGIDADALTTVGFVAQDAPVYDSLTVADHLQLGRRTNAIWDRQLAQDRVERLGLDRRQRAGRLSGGQRSQLALTLAMAKRPELLVLDEPVASLDPLARRGFLADVVEMVAERGSTVVLSSHLIADVERICDHLIVMVEGQVAVAGPVEQLLASHKVLTGARRDVRSMPKDQLVVQERHTDRQTTVLVQADGPVLDPGWIVSEVGLEDLVLAYMTAGNAPARALRAVAS
ncbi:MAG: ABC transporter ATP-binding protein [Acidimicrobiales bacterium]